MKKNILTLLSLVFVTTLFVQSVTPETPSRFWNFQSIDTMKYSRDISREKLHDSSFDETISQQVKNIANTGATHIALATPYDEEFIPFLRRWVKSARDNNLKIWFRGNWAGWEKWFDYPQIDRKTHIEKTYAFITENPDLFENGDVFSACPECENGGPGDPRFNNDLEGHRSFLTEEYQVTKKAFDEIGKDVASNFASMNGDVAKLVMNQETTKAMDGIAVIDHYVKTPDQLVNDIRDISEKSGGKVILGEFGAPIVDIHGNMTEEEQAIWLESALTKLIKEPKLEGISYWVNSGGSTQLWDIQGNPRQAVEILTKVYRPKEVKGVVKNEIGTPISPAVIQTSAQSTETDSNGMFVLPVLSSGETIQVSAEGYAEKKVISEESPTEVTLIKKDPSMWFIMLRFIHNIF